MPNVFVARVSGVSLSAATTRTMLQLVTASTNTAAVRAWGVSFNGTDATKEPILVDLLRQTTAGTSSSLTVVEQAASNKNNVTTALQTFSSTEPTAGDVLWSSYFTPVGGGGEFTCYPGEEIVMDVSTRLGLRVTTATGVTCSCSAYIKFLEW